MKPILDLVIDANVVLVLAFCLWRLAQTAIDRSRMRTDYVLQLRLLRMVLACVALSPILSALAVAASLLVWPNAPVTVSDLIVASYLRGEIAISALRFEELLTARNRLLDTVLSGQLPWLTAVLVAICTGSSLLMLRSGLAILQIRRLVAQSYVWRRTRSTDIRLSDTATIPFVARGLLRRHVVLPSRIVTSPKDLRIVIAHEFEHVRQGDAEWELAFAILRPILYFNPAFLLWNRAFDRLRELNCDQAVLESVPVSPGEYARCLLGFCGSSARRRTASDFSVAFVRAGSRSARAALENRMLALGVSRSPRSTPLVFTVFASLLALGVMLSAASVRSPGDWSHDRLMLSTIVNLERLEAINRGYH